jgi:uracil-DNA glycosylase
MDLSDEIRKCTKCIDIGLVASDRLNTSRKPYVQFDVEGKWRPDKVKVLFIAESPPWNGKQRYFYNQTVVENRTNLQKEVREYLGLKSLEEFRSEGYFLIDAIKCRLNKSEKKSVPRRVLRTCANKFLHKEITDLRPATIFILGNSSKHAVEEFSEFQDLKKHEIRDDYDKNLLGYRVILCPYPGAQTRTCINEIKRSFSKILPH